MPLVSYGISTISIEYVNETLQLESRFIQITDYEEKLKILKTREKLYPIF